MKSLLLLTALAAGPSMAQAQSDKFGLKAGVSFTTLTQSSSQLRTGFHAGLFFQSHLGGACWLQPELLYAQKGFQYDDKSQEINQVLHYLNLLVLLQFRLGGTGFLAEAGPQLGMLPAAYLTQPATSTQAATIEDSGVFKTFELGYVLGLGFQSEKGFLLSLRYNAGLTDVGTGTLFAGPQILVRPESHNAALQLSAGFVFGGCPAAEQWPGN